MKIKKQDINRIIEILQDANNQLKEDEQFCFKNNILFIEKVFEIPDKWSLDKIHDIERQEIIKNFMDKNRSGAWKLEYASEYYVYGQKVPDGWIFSGNKSMQFKMVTFEQFLEYIYPLNFNKK